MSKSKYQLRLFPQRFKKAVGVAVALAALIPGLALADLSNVPERDLDITIKRIKASQFLHQATFGPTIGQINGLANRMAAVGDTRALNEWIDTQFAIPFRNRDNMETIARDMISDDGFTPTSLFSRDDRLKYGIQNYRHHAWYDRALRGRDQLRLRVAWALSQIMVISESGTSLNRIFFGDWLGMLDYYDVLTRNSFGNYRDLLYDVTLHPAMGNYLSHVKNQKGNDNRGTFPDENFAREILQLFSIGVYRRTANGTIKLDRDGNPVENYDNETIRNFARVFTGLSYAPSRGSDDFRRNKRNMVEPMKMYNDFHDRGEKTLLNGVVLPAGQGGLKDIRDAIDNIFSHPNVAPLVAESLIKRFVTSNPRPRYIRAVANAFNDGDRGDMKAVIRAVLMHPDARESLQVTSQRRSNGSYDIKVQAASRVHGKMREPQLALTAMLRAFRAKSSSDDGRFRMVDDHRFTSQASMTAPSVFNYYLPDFQPPGEIQRLGLVAPEAQIYTPVMINTFITYLNTMIIDRSIKPRAPGILNMTPEDRVGNPEALVNRLDLLLTYGTLDPKVRQELITVLTNARNDEERTELAITALMGSPDFLVME